MTADPLGQARRGRRRLDALGADPDADPDDGGPACALCAESRLFALHVKIGHHVAGRRNDPDLTVPLCLNCHAEQTEAHRRVGLPLRDSVDPPPTLLDRLAALLAGAGVFLTELGERMVAWADVLRQLVAALDQGAAGWRDVIASVPGPPGITIPPVPEILTQSIQSGGEHGPHGN